MLSQNNNSHDAEDIRAEGYVKDCSESYAKSLLLIGGGGHALSVLEALYNNPASGSGYEKIAVLDMPEKVGSMLLDLPIIGTEADLGALRSDYTHAFISVGSIGGWRTRERLYRLVDGRGYTIPNIIHPKACLSRYSRYKTGIFAGANVTVNAGSDIRELCILNTGCIVEHGCFVGAYAHIAPGAIICGDARIGAGTHIGAGSTVIQGVKVGEDAIIGAGSVVTRDIPDRVVAYGAPCRVIRPNA